MLELKYWEPESRKYKRDLALGAFDIPSLKKYYEDVVSSDSSKKALEPKNSSSSGSKLTEGSYDSFDEAFNVQNVFRNKERREMR